MNSNLNLLSLYYFTVLAKELHMTRAAQKLYITQQNLSQHVQKLEDHYGVKLFERKPKMALTLAGEQLYRSAVKMLNEEDLIVNKFTAFSEKGIGRLRISIPTYRGNILLPYVLPRFYTKWPNVTIEFVDESSDKTEKMLFENQLDLFIGIKYNNDPALHMTTLMNDLIYLVATDELLKRYTTLTPKEIKTLEKDGTTLEPFAKMPFLLQKGTPRLRMTIDNCIKESGITPKIFLESTTSELLLSLFPYHYGALFLTQSRLPELYQVMQEAHLFPLLSNGKLLLHRLVLAYHRDYDMPPYASDFIVLLREAVSKLTEEDQRILK
jgi:DNA-binding transcriptional LysR family regulator